MNSETADPREIILIKTGELALKGLNRGTFEAILLKNLRHRLSGLGGFRFRKAQSTIYAEPLDSGIDMEEAARRVSEVFGLAAYSLARVTGKNMDDILEASADFLGGELNEAQTFKVEAKRSDKSFELKSPEICDIAGRYILDRFSHLKVDVHNPDAVVFIEIRDFGAYIHSRQHAGAGDTGRLGRALRPADFGYRFSGCGIYDGKARHLVSCILFSALYKRARRA